MGRTSVCLVVVEIVYDLSQLSASGRGVEQATHVGRCEILGEAILRFWIADA